MICAACEHENALSARFCEQCGAPLASRCPACGAELSATARFCSACGTRISPDGDPSDGAIKVVSVVFSDLVGSTDLQEQLENEAARRVMARFYETMRSVADRHAGQVQKFIGDAVVVVFGVPVVREDDALRAVRCAAEMVAALKELNQELESTQGVRLALRTGVNTGELVVNRDGIFVGDTMNTAARLEQTAAAGEVLVGEATQRLVRHHVELEAVAPLQLKGKSQRVPAWRLVSAAPGSGGARPADPPLVGREAELGRLRSVLSQVIERRTCQLVTVIGSPGLGKSRLAREFSASVDDLATVLDGHCEPSGEGVTFLPVADVLRGAAAIDETDPPELVIQKLVQVMGDDPEAQIVVRRAAGVLGAGERASPEETFWGFRRVLESLARQRGALVVLLDDVHWGQPMFLDLVEHLVEWVRDAPILLVALTRPELRELRGALTTAGRRACEVIDLSPLAPEQSRELVDGLLGAVELESELLERILATTEGNPLFLSELLRMLVDEGALVRSAERDRWVAAGGAEAVQVPPTIQALLTARIERLRSEERTVVERAAVIGQQFYRGAVADLTPPPVSAGLDGYLEMLRRKEMVEPDGTYWIDEPVYRFHHVLIRDAAYRLLLKEARAELHERFADWLASKAGDLVGEHEEVIAYHLEQAHEYRRQLGPLDERGLALGRRASALLASAGRRALARADLAAAANLLQRALDRGEDSAEAELLWDLLEALLSAGEAARAAAPLTRLAELSNDRARVLSAQLAVLTGERALELSLSDVVAAVEKLAAAGDGAGEAKGHHVVAQIQAQLGQVADVEASLDRALLAARRTDDRRRITAVLAAAPRAALWGPSPVVRASGRCLDVVRILRMTPGNRHVEAVALRCQAVLEAMRGRPQAAREILDAGRATLEELGLTLELHELETHAGIVELLAGAPDTACELLGAARRGFAALGLGVAAAQAAALLGRAFVEIGRDDEAIAETEFAEARAGGDLKTTITWLGVRAEALARTAGGAAEALELAQRALALAEPTDALADKADAHMALARVLSVTGDTAGAAVAATDALALYEAKDHTVGARRAREMLSLGPARAPAQDALARRAGLGDRPPERLIAEFRRRFNAHRPDELLELLAEGFVREDHRAVGWGSAGASLVGDDYRSTFAGSEDIRFELHEVLACDDRVIAWRGEFRGTARPGGGEFVMPYGSVALIEDERWVREDIYEPVDRQAMIARYAELGGGQGKLGDRSPDDVTRAFARAYASRDLDRLAALVTDDFVMVDRRGLSWEETTGREAWLPVVRSGYHGVTDSRVEIDEVLACDDRVIAVLISWRGTAASRAGGGPYEFTVGHVTVMDGGRMSRVEQFAADEREPMLRRYLELGGTTLVLRDRPSERFLAELQRLLHQRDYERAGALVAEDWQLIDHRAVGWEAQHGREAWEASTRSYFDASPTARVDVEEVIACDDRVIAVRIAWRDQGVKAGALEVLAGAVHLIEDGRWISVDYYDPEDRQAIITRYVELGGGLGPLGDTQAERLYAEFARRYARRDFGPLLEMIDEGFEWNDHRNLGWEPFRGQDGLRAVTEPAWAGSADIRIEVDEVLAAGDRVIATRVRWTGHDLRHGAFEFPAGQVVVWENGRGVSLDQFDEADRDATLARYTELQEPRDALAGTTAPERFLDEFRARIDDSDWRRLGEMVSEDWVWQDHRALGWENATGRDACVALMRSFREAGPEVRIEFDEVLACDERVIACVQAWRGPGIKAGELEVTAGVVFVVENGQWVSGDFYDPHARQAIVTRYVELGGGLGLLGDSPPERWLAEWARRYPTADFDGMAALTAPACSFRDHRQLGWDPISSENGMAELARSIWSGTSDVRLEVDEVLACDARVAAVRVSVHATSRRHGIRSQTATGAVIAVEDGRLVSWDQYEESNRDAILARYTELQEPPDALAGSTMPRRFFARFFDRLFARDYDRLGEMVAEDWSWSDHRALAWEQANGREACLATMRSLADGAPGVRIEFDEILAEDERVLAALMSWRGHGVKAGDLEVTAGAVMVVEDGRWLRADFYDPTDREAIIARYAEAGGGLAPLGDTPVERLLRHYAERYAARDLDGATSTLAESWRHVDHRQLGWAGLGRDQYREEQVGVWESTADVRIEVDEVLACDGRVLAGITTYYGTAAEAIGGGSFEYSVGIVTVAENGVTMSTDWYEPDDREAILSRYRELTALRAEASSDRAPAPGTPPPEEAPAAPPASPA